jgi:hypothetical protein
MPLKSGALNGKIWTSLVADQLRYSLELWSSTSATIPVKRVYLGARAPQELETSIRRLLHDRHDVQILRTKPSLTNFDLSYG